MSGHGLLLIIFLVLFVGMAYVAVASYLEQKKIGEFASSIRAGWILRKKFHDPFREEYYEVVEVRTPRDYQQLSTHPWFYIKPVGSVMDYKIDDPEKKVQFFYRSDRFGTAIVAWQIYLEYVVHDTNPNWGDPE